MASNPFTESRSKSVGILHSAVVGAVVLGIIFVACWLLAFTPVQATHAFIKMFTTAEITSWPALGQGLCLSVVFGAWVGFLIALVNRFVPDFGASNCRPAAVPFENVER